MTDAEHWAKLQRLAKGLGEKCPDAVFIGGLAVFAHAARLGSRWQETSHDVDLCISAEGKGTLRERYDTTSNPQLHKDSVRIESEDFDVYTEYQNDLAIPYDLIASFSVTSEGFRVASLEHLLVLKIDAALGRPETLKGEKDLRDLVRILTLLKEPREELIAPYLTPEREGVLQRVTKRADVLLAMGLNPHEASRYRPGIAETVKTILSGGREGGSRARTP
jgi:hypothetical protein